MIKRIIPKASKFQFSQIQAKQSKISNGYFKGIGIRKKTCFE
jgi:hypothetical protein